MVVITKEGQMICPLYKAALLSQTLWSNTTGEINDRIGHGAAECDRYNCALWEPVLGACGLNNTWLKRIEESRKEAK